MLNIKDQELKLLRESQLNDKVKAFIIKDKYNCNYVTGYTGEFAAAIITGGNNYIVVNSLYKEQVNQETSGYIPVVFSDHPDETVAQILEKEQIRDIAGEFVSEEEACAKYSVSSAIKKNDYLTEKRIIKNQYELDCIRKANQISCDAFNHCIGLIKPGMTELEVAAEIEYYMKKHGSYHTSFDTIVVSGIRSALPHGSPGEKKIQPGDPVTMDFGATYRSYCADITRTVFVGKPSEEMREIYNVVLDAQVRTTEYVKSGLTGVQIDAFARDIITKAGYGEYFVHGLGHGVGLQVHEAPSLNRRGTVAIPENAVVTVEPGIYKGQIGGVRIEDSVIVKRDGVEILTSSASKELVIL